jgi:hypothetical protein
MPLAASAYAVLVCQACVCSTEAINDHEKLSV